MARQCSRKNYNRGNVHEKIIAKAMSMKILTGAMSKKKKI